MIFIIKYFRTIVFIFIVISTTFWPICPPAFRCLSNSETFTELRTTSFIETTGVACSDSVCHNRVQVLSIPVYYSPVVRIEPATFRRSCTSCFEIYKLTGLLKVNIMHKWLLSNEIIIKIALKLICIR